VYGHIWLEADDRAIQSSEMETEQGELDMELFLYSLEVGTLSVEFFVATESDDEARKAFDITQEEFNRSTSKIDNPALLPELAQQPGKVFYQFKDCNDPLQALPKEESILTMRLQWTLSEVSAA
jgi:hypothetical protein